MFSVISQMPVAADSQAITAWMVSASPPGGWGTGEMRIDDLLSFLRERYGLYIDQLPPGEGFSAPTIDERKALRSNVQAFTGRLREIGFYRDLSDAYVTQTVVPRYTIAERNEGARA